MLPLLATILLLALAGGGALMARGWRKAGAAVAALALGPVLYLCVGIAVPRFTGVGHFYSFPVGALRVRDADILWSLLAWVLACWALVAGLAALAMRLRR